MVGGFVRVSCDLVWLRGKNRIHQSIKNRSEAFSLSNRKDVVFGILIGTIVPALSSKLHTYSPYLTRSRRMNRPHS